MYIFTIGAIDVDGNSICECNVGHVVELQYAITNLGISQYVPSKQHVP